MFISFPASADDYESTLMELKEKKKTMVSSSMELTDSQSDAFWTVYANYEKELEIIVKEEFELIKKYNSKYKDKEISEQSASNMLAKNFRIQGRKLQTKQIYLSKFQEVLPKNEVLRFYQIDNKANALIGDDLAKIIPLAGTEFQ